ncbi:MAG: terminase family protein [Candidatus Eremiobacterota bacterium]
MNKRKYFLPYQMRWLKDESVIKIWEKSRRIGATYVQSYEDVRDAIAKKVPSVWFSSADESAAKEYIEYAEQWAKLFNAAAKYLGQVVLDSDKDIKTFSIEFANGVRINALSSNPKAFRSKGGKVVLDEFAWHEQQERLWAAARPCITWGFPMRILSTHNGKSCRYYKFIEDIKREQLNWSLHTTPIQLAVKEGLVDKITGKKATEKEKEEWIEEQRKSCVDAHTWLQEYCCVPVDETSAFLTYEMIQSCERDNLFDEEIKGDLYLGMDIGRKKDLSVIWGLEKLGHSKFTRIYKVLEKAPFKYQREVLFEILKHPNLRRCCIDATGLGMQLAEEAQDAFGKYRVEAVTFTNPLKEELAYNLRIAFEDKLIFVPPLLEIREDLHSVKKITSASGNIRFDTTEKTDGHADRFWALALSNHASINSSGDIHVVSKGKREASKITRGFLNRNITGMARLYGGR